MDGAGSDFGGGGDRGSSRVRGRGRSASWRKLPTRDAATAAEAFIVGGTYREVEPPLRLVYTWRWETGPAADGSESLVTVEIEAREGRTESVLTPTEFAESHGPAPYQWAGRAVLTSRGAVRREPVDA